MTASSKEFLDIQATIECVFTLKRVHDMIRTYSQLKHVLFKIEKCSYFPEVACICETVSDILDEVGVLSIF